jgi:hypothetical protein
MPVPPDMVQALHVFISLRCLPPGSVNWECLVANIWQIRNLLPLLQMPVAELQETHRVLKLPAYEGSLEHAVQEAILSEPAWGHLEPALLALQAILCCQPSQRIPLEWTEQREAIMQTRGAKPISGARVPVAGEMVSGARVRDPRLHAKRTES